MQYSWHILTTAMMRIQMIVHKYATVVFATFFAMTHNAEHWHLYANSDLGQIAEKTKFFGLTQCSNE
jgi:hypothetical protein